MTIYIKYSGFKMPPLRNSRNWAKVGLTKSESDLKKWHFFICAHCTQNFHSHRFCTRITKLLIDLKTSGPQLCSGAKSESYTPNLRHQGP